MLESYHLRTFLLAQAELVRVEGMKAENKLAEIQGRTLPYDESQFYYAANQIEEYARDL